MSVQRSRPWRLLPSARLLAAAGLLPLSIAGPARADDVQDEITALRSQMQQIMQRLDQLTQQTQGGTAVSGGSTAAPAAVGAGGNQGSNGSSNVAGASQVRSAEPGFDAFMQGFYGTLDVSVDDTTKGIAGLVAYPYQLNDPANPNSGSSVAGGPKGGPVGRVGWMPALSSNKSVVGYRGSHQIGTSAYDVIYQVEAALALTASPGLSTGYTAQGNTVKGALGSGDTFVGFASPQYGRVKVGTTYTPYKKTTDRLNPFSGQLGDYAAIMGNSGGDNRVEFGTRQDHSIWYESPRLLDGGMGFEFLWSPGQNRTYDNVVQSSGSPDCNGGNTPGSGNLPLNCDDGGYSNALSAALHYETGGFYGTMAYEQHQNVNRNSDGIGSNHPLYAYYSGQGVSWIDNATQILPAGTTATIPLGAYTTDIGTEWAFKIGAQYRFDFGLTVSGILERLRRNVPAYLQFQNERSRDGSWLALTQEFGSDDSVSLGWGHAGATPGDPGGQHNYNPNTQDNSANMYTVAYKHKLDKQLTWYVDGALTLNGTNAHYDIGAGGRGLTTDCHDGTNTVFTDYSGAGPTTWGGCRVMGISTGFNYRF